MARKNLLKGLMEPPAPAAAAPGLETKAAGPRARALVPGRPAPARAGAGAGGAIGAVSQSIAELRARAVVDLDPHLIGAGGMTDRLEHDAAEHARLMEQIATYGQQVPVLVRPHPEAEGRYQIVYGRRRVLACQDLKIPVKAMVRELDDRDLVLAQGQENTARRDLSFIEKANFARQMVEAGFKRRIVCDALTIDKTAISKMLAVVERIPEEAILAIGPAPGIGRRRWLELAELIEKTETDGREAAALAHGATSDARFEALVHALTLPERRAAEARTARRADRDEGRHVVRDAEGEVLARVGRAGRALTLRLDAGDGFADWLVESLAGLHRDWREKS